MEDGHFGYSSKVNMIHSFLEIWNYMQCLYVNLACIHWPCVCVCVCVCVDVGRRRV